MAIPGRYLTTLYPFRPPNSLSLPSTMPSSMLYFYQEEFLDTAVPAFTSCHQVCPSEAFGECTRQQQKQTVPFTLLHTPPFAFLEKVNTICHRRSHDPTFVDNVNKTAQILYIQQTIPRPTTQLHTPMHWSTFIMLGWRGSTTSPSAMRERSCSIYHC